jgi:hypothetical protein
MQSDGGTLIVQQGHMRPTRLWWTPQDVTTLTPLPLPPLTDLIDAGGTKHPFVEWCYQRYLSADTGIAFRAGMPGRGRPDLFIKTSHSIDKNDSDISQEWRCLFPRIRVVETGFSNRKRELAAVRFTSIMDGVQAIPGLIKVSAGDDPALRQIATEALRLLGQVAAAGVPTLVPWLYDGPWRERYKVAETLANLGPQGLDALIDATKLEDPWIHEPAQFGLDQHRRSERKRLTVDEVGWPAVIAADRAIMFLHEFHSVRAHRAWPIVQQWLTDNADSPALLNTRFVVVPEGQPFVLKWLAGQGVDRKDGIDGGVLWTERGCVVDKLIRGVTAEELTRRTSRLWVSGTSV